MGETYLVVVVVVAYGYAPMSALTQGSLFDEPEVDHGGITVSNGEIYPFFRTVSTLVDECKLDVEPGELSVRAVDAANVGMIDVALSHEHGLSEFTQGVNVTDLHSRLATKPRTVDVDINFGSPEGKLHIKNDGWDVTERLRFIDPDSVRMRPDLPDVDLPVSVEVEVAPLASYLSAETRVGDFEFRTRDGRLEVAERNDDYESVAETDVDADKEVESVFSDDYITDVFTTLRSVGVETATVNIGDEFPLIVDFETDSLSGYYMVAPRIQG
jgi:proliferating cell nuclear antigen